MPAHYPPYIETVFGQYEKVNCQLRVAAFHKPSLTRPPASLLQIALSPLNVFQRTRAAPLTAGEHEECAKLQRQMECLISLTSIAAEGQSRLSSQIAHVNEKHSQSPGMAKYLIENLRRDRERFHQELQQIDYMMEQLQIGLKYDTDSDYDDTLF